MSNGTRAVTSHGLFIPSGGSITPPSTFDVRAGVDRGDGQLGTLTLPTPAQVLYAIEYGGAGTQYTGTLNTPPDLTGPDIKRSAELYLCAKLTAAVPGHNFQPFTGGTDSADETDLEPPFTVIAISQAEALMETEGTWQCRGTAQIITYNTEVTTPAHALLVRSIYAALKNLTPNENDPSFSFHGMDITNQTSAQDDADRAHADIIAFTIGCGG